MKLTESYLKRLIKQAINEMGMGQGEMDYRSMAAPEGDTRVNLGTFLRTFLRNNPNATNEEIEKAIKDQKQVKDPFNYTI